MEQNRKRYSSLAKAIVIGLQMIAAVMASVSIVLFSTCVNQNMLNMGDLQNSSFVESGYFERTFSKQMMQLSDYLNLKEQFETDGVYDENRPETVNASQEQISDYKIYNNKYDQNNTNVYYWLGNLKDGTYVTNMRDVKKQEDAYEKTGYSDKRTDAFPPGAGMDGRPYSGQRRSGRRGLGRGRPAVLRPFQAQCV